MTGAFWQHFLHNILTNGNKYDILTVVLPIGNELQMESEVIKVLNTEYVQELMDAKGWTLGQLSWKSGISKAQLGRLMRDKRGAGAKTMEGIMHAFPEADVGKFFTNSATY